MYCRNGCHAICDKIDGKPYGEPPCLCWDNDHDEDEVERIESE